MRWPRQVSDQARGCVSSVVANSIGSGTSILWFRRDLRVHDHPALTAAIMASEHVLPVFVVDDALIRGRWPSPNRAWFMLESLRALDSALRERGSGLRVLRGRPAEVLPAFAAEAGVRDMYITRDYTPYARRRDKEVARALDAVGARLHARPGLLVAEPEEVATNEGRPFSVFSPFRRRWESVPPRTVLAAPERISTPADGARGSGIPTLDELGIEAPTAEIIAPGEAAARGRLEIWADSVAVPAYKVQRDRLDLDATSRLSQDLRWGLLSPVEVLSRCAGDDPGRAAYATEICWREFYYHVLWHHPRLRRTAFQIRFDALAYRESPSLLHAWQSGRTGYPVVDAAMRQLVATGWMHNRARMIVVDAFPTRDQSEPQLY